MSQSNPKIYVVFNPTAGNAAEADAVRKAITKHFAPPQYACEVYETTGKKDEDIPALVRKAVKDGAEIVVCAGGDGTLISVANGLVHSKVPLGILPLGTGNDLARILNIPLKLDAALDVLTGNYEVFEMDALKANDRYYLSNVSVGVSPKMMKDTKTEAKKRFGRLAYIWTMFKESGIFQMRNYTVTIDNQTQRVNAVEIMISNSTLLEAPPNLFGSLDTLNDGKLEVYLIKAKTLRHYLQMAWDLIRRQPPAKLAHQAAKNTIRIEADRSSQLVQADGDVIGHTPVEIKIERNALRVIMPKPAPEAAKGPLEVLKLQNAR